MKKDFSKNGEQLLKSLEGYSAKAYKDSAGKLTIGYGHVVVRGDGVAPGEVINEFKATELLEADLKKAIDVVNTCVISNDLNQNQFDALVIFTYNVGATAFMNSSLLRLVNENKLEEAEDEFPKWCKIHTPQGAFVEIAGLKKRRLAEQQLFGEPVQEV